MSKFVYVDNSNVFIEGQRVAAVENGNALSIQDAISRQIFDSSYRLDFGKLYNLVASNGNSNAERAMLFGSRPPPNDSLWAVAESAGFELVIVDRNLSNKEKKIDTGIVTAMLTHAFTEADAAKDQFILVAGDSDYVPVVEALSKNGFTINIVFWDHASRELQNVCSNFVSMNSHFEKLAR